MNRSCDSGGAKATNTSFLNNLEDEDEDINNIPLADDDPQALIPEPDETPSQSEQVTSSSATGTGLSRSFDSFPSTFTNDSLSSAGLDPDLSQDEQEEKASRIAQVLELQNTLDDLSQRVESVKEENLKLRSENQVLGQYIESLMSASSVFQPTSPKTKRKGGGGSSSGHSSSTSSRHSASSKK